MGGIVRDHTLRVARMLWRYPRTIGMHLAPRRRVRTRGLTFTLPCDNPTTYFRWKSYNDKEPETLDWIDRDMRDGDVLIDVGANIGVYTVYAAMRHPASRVVALEPEYANLHLLRDNVVLNGLTGRVDVFAVAVSDRSRLSYLHVQDLTPGAALHTESREARAATDRPTVCREGVFGQTLDDFCEETGVVPHCLKIDVDGNEPKVLAGAQRTLRTTTLRSVLIELPADPAARTECESQLSRAGFSEALSGSGNSVWSRSAVRVTV